MDENENLSNQLNFLGHSNDEQQANHFPLYNSNISTINNGLYGNMFACDQQYLQPLAPVNNTALIVATENNNPILMPPESIPLSYYDTNIIHLHASIQDPAYYNDAGGVDPLDPNWEAINAFLAGRVRRGADVTQVYHCCVCNAEFISPQAQGGHMSSHSRKRKNKDIMTSTKPKKCKRIATKKLKKAKSL